MTSMLFSRRPVAASALLGEPLSELALRVRAPRQEDRIIRLSGAKLSIGSAEQCSLRLRAPGVAGTHCWILRGPEGVAIRSLGALLRVNGVPAEEARLEPGDSFEIGPITFELLSGTSGRARRTAPRNRLAAELANATQAEAAAIRRETRRQQHARLRSLLQTLRQDRQKAGEQRRDSERQRRDTEQLQVQLVQLQRELGEERNNVQRVEDQRRSSSLQANQLQLTLERLRHELSSLQSQQQQEASLFRQERSRLSEDLANRERHVHQLRVDLQQRLWDLEQLRLQLDRQQRQADLDREQREALQTQRQQEQELWLGERTRLAEEVTQRERQLQQLQGDLRTAQAACQQLQAELQRLQTAGETNERSLARDLERFRLASEQAASDAAAWKQNHATLTKESAERDRWARELEAELAQQTGLNERLTTELRQTREQLAKLQVEANDLRARWERDRAHLQSALDHQQTEESWHAEKLNLLETVTSRDRELDTQRSEVQRIVSELAQVRTQLEEQIRTTADREAAWNDERTQAKTRLEEQTVATAAAEERRTALEQEMQHVQAELADATTTVATWKQAAEDARTRIEQLEKKLAAQNAMLANQAQQTIALDTTQSQRYQSLERRVTGLTSEKESLEQRLAELTSQLEQKASSNEAELAQLVEQREALAMREGELEELRAQLAARAAELEQRQAEPSAAAGPDLAVERAQLDQERAALHEEKEQVAHERGDLERVRAQLAEQREALAEQERLLERQAQEATAQREALEESRRELAAEYQRIAQAPAAEPALCAATIPQAAQWAEVAPPANHEVPMDHEGDALSPAIREAMTQPTPQAFASEAEEEALNGQTICPSGMDLSRLATLDFDAQPEPSPTGSKPLESVEEVLARLGRQGLWKPEADEPEAQAAPAEQPALAFDNERSEEDAALPNWSAMNALANPPPSLEPAGWRGAAGKAPLAESDEESIDDYMARLMNRVQGTSDSGAAPVVSRPTRDESARKSTSKPVVSAAPSEPPSGEYSPRSAAPEQSHNLAAMRELANESARSAIRTHEKRSGKERHVGHLLSATVLVLLSAPMLWLAWQFHSWLFAGSFVVTVGLAAWWLRVTFLAACCLLKSACKSAVLPTPSEPENRA